MTLQTWLLFLVTAMGMSLSPGPNSLLVLTHASTHGARRTLPTIVGGLLAFGLIIAGCIFGIGALLQASVHGLLALKVCGGLYLVWLGIQAWRAPPMAIQPGQAPACSARTLFRQGFVCGITNPKSTLLFTALLPQFINPQASLWLQCAVLVATYWLTEFTTEVAIALGAVRLRPWLARMGRSFNRFCGGLFVAIGAALPFRL